MSQAAMIASIVALIGSLILVTRNSGLRGLGTARIVRLMLIWAVIIIGLMLLIQVLGLRIGD